MARKKAGDKKIAVGNINDVSGEVTIAGGDIHKGFTAEQVSVLIKQITTTFQPNKFDGRSPYKGLDVFEEEDAELFFGRERLVNELVGRVKESRTVFITGPSGSGKSSLVRAGLIHALKQGAIKSLHSERWLYETMKPGREPIKELSLTFSRLKSPELANYFQVHANEVDILNECAESALSGQKNQRFVLFIDQFEEIFTQINQEEERLTFLNMLAHAGTVENGRVIVLFSMRSDFVSNCATYPAINEMLSQQFRQIGAMQPEELVAAIALPAKQVGLPIENELIAQIINDMKGEPGSLPLMQFALKDLFDSQQEKGGVIVLTLEDYLRHGGIQKSLERHADASLAALDEKEQNLARSIFSGLIEIGRGTQDTKRTALFDELVPANTKTTDVEAIVQKLADARLITTDEQAGKDTVTISHEKLIDAWPWLKKLVNENRDVIALQNEIANDAKEWEEHSRDTSYLYAGARLVNADEQLKSNKLVLNENTFEFIRASLARQQRDRFVLIGGLVTIIGLLVLAVFIFRGQSNDNKQLAQINANIANTARANEANAISAKATAQANEKIARAGELVTQSIEKRDQDFQTSLLLSVEAFRVLDNIRTRGNLLDGINTNPQLLQFLTGNTNAVLSMQFSPDSKILTSVDSNGTIRLWDLATQNIINQFHTGQSEVHTVAFSPDGHILALSNGRDTVLWDMEKRHTIAQPLTVNHVNSIVFSPNGKILASGGVDKDGRATVILWDVVAGRPLGQPITKILASPSLAFSPDSKTIAIADIEILLWDIASDKPVSPFLRAHTDLINSIAFSPDGKTLISGSVDRTIILWDVKTGHPIGQRLTGQGLLNSIAFSPGGKAVATSSVDDTIVLWNVETLIGPISQPINPPLKGHTSGLTSIVFSPDSETLASSDEQGKVILWDVMPRWLSNNYPYISFMPSALRSTVALDADGKTIALGSGDNVIKWDISLAFKTTVAPSWLSEKSFSSVALSPNGKILASGGHGDFGQTIILWDTKTHKPLGQPLTGQLGVSSLAFSPDGKILASITDYYSSMLILWDVATHQPIGPPLNWYIDHGLQVESIRFSPDGKTLVGKSELGTITAWDINPDSWVEKTCQRIDRNFTRAEWELYFPNEEYRKTCEQWPLEPETTPTPSPTP